MAMKQQRLIRWMGTGALALATAVAVPILAPATAGGAPVGVQLLKIIRPNASTTKHTLWLTTADRVHYRDYEFRFTRLTGAGPGLAAVIQMTPRRSDGAPARRFALRNRHLTRYAGFQLKVEAIQPATDENSRDRVQLTIQVIR
jgi:hypothetical protein